MKIPVEYLRFMWPMRTFLLTCGKAKENPNIISVSFCMPVSKNPPLIAFAVSRSAHSAKLIEENGEFVVNVPEERLKSEIYYCGYHSGSKVDKFKETGLTAKDGKVVSAPIIDECTAHMECVLKSKFETGDKYLFVGEVVEAYADEDVASGQRVAKFEAGEFPAHVYSTRAEKEGRRYYDK